MNNIFWHESKVNKKMRQSVMGQKSFLIWLTGLSGSGKSTIANNLEQKLFYNGYHTYILDGDNIRTGLNSDLGFSPQDRKENIRRIGHVAKLFVDSGIIVISAFISPYKEDRSYVRNLFEKDEFFEVFVKCDIETCSKRDTKNLYAKAKTGEIKNFTGISDSYETPENPELILETDKYSLEYCVDYLYENIYYKLKIN